MRNLSCSMTIPQVRARTKTVTRRMGWWNPKTDEPLVKPGDRLRLVEKGMGLKSGEKVAELAVVEVVSVTRELLCDITSDEVAREGFSEMSPIEFGAFFCEGHKGAHWTLPVTRIEWRYLDGEVTRYKGPLYGTSILTVDRWYPSSKACSGCGSVKSKLSLSERTYVCHECGLIMDRDHNAALNILTAGLAGVAHGPEGSGAPRSTKPRRVEVGTMPCSLVGTR